MFSETHAAQRAMLICDIIAKMRHDGCGGRAGRVELLTGIEGASRRPMKEWRTFRRGPRQTVKNNRWAAGLAGVSALLAALATLAAQPPAGPANRQQRLLDYDVGRKQQGAAEGGPETHSSDRCGCQG
jgi:hypothetical protein